MLSKLAQRRFDRLEKKLIAFIENEDDPTYQQLDTLVDQATALSHQLKREKGVGKFCCRRSENSNGWHHLESCKNYTVGY